MSYEPLEYLRHMRDEAAFLASQTTSLTKEAFLNDELLRRAFVRCIEVIGEAAKHVPEDFRAQHPQIPWRVMAGMRDRLIHGYLAVDYDIVWDVAANHATLLCEAIRQILDRDERPFA